MIFVLLLLISSVKMICSVKASMLYILLLNLSVVFIISGKEISQKEDNWTYLVFAQRWPPSVCLDLAQGKCLIPKDLPQTMWVIHGLWPTADHGYPSFCNQSWAFQEKDIDPILPLMKEKWPNLIRGASGVSFWKHEWMKHGTCATTVPSLDGVRKYFMQALELESKFNLYDVFRKISFTPGETPYLLDWIEKGISLQLNTTATIICKSHKGYEYPVIDTVYLCMDKSFNLIKCDVTNKKLCNASKVLYPPFPPNLPNSNFIL